MRYVLLASGGVLLFFGGLDLGTRRNAALRYVLLGTLALLFAGCATMDTLMYGPITPEDERLRAETKCPEGQEARLVGNMLPGIPTTGWWEVKCRPTQVPSTQQPTHPALSESQRR